MTICVGGGDPLEPGAAAKEAAPGRIDEAVRQNRKRGPLRVGTVSKVVVACAAVMAFGLTYVWQKNQLYRLGEEIKRREALASAAQKRGTMLAAQLAQLKSPALLEQRCQQYGLGLVAPRETQLVRLPEPGPEWDLKLPVTTAPAPPAKKAPSRPQPKTVARR